MELGTFIEQICRYDRQEYFECYGQIEERLHNLEKILGTLAAQHDIGADGAPGRRSICLGADTSAFFLYESVKDAGLYAGAAANSAGCRLE